MPRHKRKSRHSKGWSTPPTGPLPSDGAEAVSLDAREHHQLMISHPGMASLPSKSPSRTSQRSGTSLSRTLRSDLPPALPSTSRPVLPRATASLGPTSPAPTTHIATSLARTSADNDSVAAPVEPEKLKQEQSIRSPATGRWTLRAPPAPEAPDSSSSVRSQNPATFKTVARQPVSALLDTSKSSSEVAPVRHLIPPRSVFPSSNGRRLDPIQTKSLPPKMRPRTSQQSSTSLQAPAKDAEGLPATHPPQHPRTSEMHQESRADAEQVLEPVSKDQARISDAKHGLSFDRRPRMSMSYPAPVVRHNSHEDLSSILTIKSDMSRKTLATVIGALGNTPQHTAPLSSQSSTMAPELITPQPPANQRPLSRSVSDSSTAPTAEHGPRDDVTLFVGRHGSFQLTTFHFGLIAAFVLPFHTTVLNRITPDIDHWCARPDNMRNLSVEQWKRQMIPKMENGNYSRCTMFNGLNKSSNSVVPCDSWEFDINARGSYIVQDFSLICDRSWGFPMSTSIFMVGAMCSLSISGPLADRMGRKPLIQFSVVVTQICGIVILFSQLFHTFLAMRFLLGAATLTLVSTSYVLVIEVMAPDFRLLYGMAVLMGHAAGSVTTACLGWFNVHWRNIQIVGMLPALLLLRVITSLSESPRWLLAKGSTEEAEAVIMRAASMNGENLLELKRHWTRTRREIEREVAAKPPMPTCREILRLHLHERNSIILYYCWTVTSFTTQTAAVRIQCFGFYPSALMTLAAVLEIPAELGAIVSAARLGRRTSHATALFCAGLAGAIALILSEEQVIPKLAVVIAVKVSVRASECLIIMYTAEVYPTLFRCTGVAFCYCFSAMGNIATQLVANTGFLDQTRVPLVLVSVMCVTGAFLALQLPDSKEGRLPDTLQDVPSYWGRMNRRSYPRQRGILRTAWPDWRHKRRQPFVGS